MSINDDTTHDEHDHDDFDEGAGDPVDAPYGVPDADAVAENAARDMAEDEAAGEPLDVPPEAESSLDELEQQQIAEERAAEALAAESAEAAAVTADALVPPLAPERRFTRHLLCKLDSDARAKMGSRLSDAVTAWEERENEIKAQAKLDRAELEEMWEEVKRLNRIVRDGGEERPVECMEIRDDRTGAIEVVRTDTGEVIDKRAQTVDERQLPLTAAVQEDAEPDRPTRAQCATTRDGEQCEGVCADGQAYCPECIADAVARDDAAEAERAKAAPRCAIGGCEEEAGASGYCGQHDRTERPTCAAEGCTALATSAGLFCEGHSETVTQKRKRARKGAAAEV